MIILEMTREECDALLNRSLFGRLACVREQQPYVVPVYFVSDNKHLYGFSLEGQKIEWMRSNPWVCVEVDEIIDHLHWQSVVVLGRYEELRDDPAHAGAREYALELLQRRALWWQTAYGSVAWRIPATAKPVFYRIRIDRITGHQGSPDPLEVEVAPAQGKRSKEPEERNAADRIKQILSRYQKSVN